MQRFTSFAGSSSRFVRVIALNHLKNDRSLFEQSTELCTSNNIIFRRCLATKNNNIKNADLYKPSTAKEKTHVPDELKNHHQPPETINSTINAASISGGKVWSNQNPDAVHVAPLGRIQSTTFVPKSDENNRQPHETTVYTTQGELNIVDPFQTHTLQPEATPGQLAEAAAASAFDTYAPNTPLTSTSGADSVFAPKISSTEMYSHISSPTADFRSNVPSSSNESVKYEAAGKGRVFGGQDTSADTKRHPNDDTYVLAAKNKARQAK